MHIDLKMPLLSLLIISLIACTSHEDKFSSKMPKEKYNAEFFISDKDRLDDVFKDISMDKNLTRFLQGYKHIHKGEIIQAENIFSELESNNTKEAIEFAKYGLLLIAVETENMLEMSKVLENINSINNKPKWLEEEVLSYTIFYNYKVANYENTENLLDSIPESYLVDSPLLISIKALLQIRENQLDIAKITLKSLKESSFDTIATKAFLLSITNGYPATINYLENQVEEYPDNENLKALRNAYLVMIDKDKAFKEAYSLGLKSGNTYNVVSSIQTLLFDVSNASPDRMKMLNTLAIEHLDKIPSSRKYIDYYLINIVIPMSNKQTLEDISLAEDFNPNNYELLWQKYYAADLSEKLYYLKKIEHIDPYDNQLLLELAQFYKYKGMTEELSHIKQRFRNSKRIKTDDEIKFMNSL